MNPRLHLRCGCQIQFRDGKPPRCLAHGEQRVLRVQGMPAPTFTGAVKGRHATTTDVEPFVGRLSGTEES